MTEPLPAPAPLIDADSREFWAATTRGELLLRACAGCDFVMWPARPFCPRCHATSTSWRTASGRGVIYSLTVVRRGAKAYAKATPYVLSYVELAEGPRVLTNIVEADPEALRIGDPVELVWHPAGDDAALPRWRPAR